MTTIPVWIVKPIPRHVLVEEEKKTARGIDLWVVADRETCLIRRVQIEIDPWVAVEHGAIVDRETCLLIRHFQTEIDPWVDVGRGAIVDRETWLIQRVQTETGPWAVVGHGVVVGRETQWSRLVLPEMVPGAVTGLRTVVDRQMSRMIIPETELETVDLEVEVVHEVDQILKEWIYIMAMAMVLGFRPKFSRIEYWNSN
jgi:hypothetical protein